MENALIKFLMRKIERILAIHLYIYYWNCFWKKEPVWDLGDMKFITRRGSTDRLGVFEICKMDLYNPKGLEINREDVVVDVGGNIGAFTVYAAKKADKGTVIVYEPFPENFALMNRNIALNDMSNIQVYEKGFSDKTGIEKLYLSELGHGNHSITNDSKKSIDIPCVSIQDVFAQNNLEIIDFLKMDIEGAEYKIFFSMPVEYLQRIKLLSIEFHSPKKNRKKLIKLLEDAGFIVTLRKPPLSNQGYLYAVNKSLVPSKT
ncbi:MAG: FkbM family methyltransferase [Candidatus Hodarchaeales archaeon]|jgi:FkbM family methyltransferase